MKNGAASNCFLCKNRCKKLRKSTRFLHRICECFLYAPVSILDFCSCGGGAKHATALVGAPRASKAPRGSAARRRLSPRQKSRRGNTLAKTRRSAPACRGRRTRSSLLLGLRKTRTFGVSPRGENAASLWPRMRAGGQCGLGYGFLVSVRPRM